MKQEYDVIVIGAGPAGGRCAANLSKAGLSVLLVERFASFYDNDFSSAGMSMQGFNEFNIPESVIGRYWKNFAIQSSNELARWTSKENKGVVLDFAKLRQHLADECTKNGGDVLMGYSYTSKKITEDGVIATLKPKKGNEILQVKTKLLVDATGPARKVIYNSLEEQPEMESSVGVEYLIKVDDTTYNKYKDDLFFFLGDKWCYRGYSWIFPMDNNTLKVGTAKMISNEVKEQPETLKQITERIIKDYMLVDNYVLLDFHGGKVRITKEISEAFYQNKVVAIGDSISAINPLGGEGIRYALRSADDVTPHIINYINNKQNTFANYRKKWRKKYLFTWKLCFFLAENMYDKYSDEKIDDKIKRYQNYITIDQLIDILFEFKFNKMFRRLFSFFWNRFKNTMQLKKSA